jgi:chromosome segregation ATPase
MLTIEQVRALETRIEKAVNLVASLREENAQLKKETISVHSALSAAELRVVELESVIAGFQKDQARIEQGIIDALRKLDAFEDTVHTVVAAPSQEARNSETSHTVTHTKVKTVVHTETKEEEPEGDLF